MNNIYLNGNDETAKILANAGFPNYKGRKFQVIVVEDNRTFNLTSGWDGGSREYYAIVRLSDMKAVNISDLGFMGNQFSRHGQDFQIPEGFVLIEHSIFCGKDMGLRFYVQKANSAKLIPAPVELTPNEELVLAATRSLKSFYMGSSRQMKSGMALSTWNETSAILQSKGLLAKNGAITAAGRNAIGDKRVGGIS